MKITHAPFSQFPMLSKMDLAYAQRDASLAPFYVYEPNMESFKKVILDKSNDSIDRKTLVSALKRQYKSLNTEGVVSQNIVSLLDEKTYTVTTAHQPSLMTND